ncbi:MAG: substrate-binding domain-containing protein [Silvibacterium sp.]|nr:substrate-binding domain-containing protein [Silvibacterium sp.]
MMNSLHRTLWAVSLAALAAGSAASAAEPYRPGQQVSGAIRVSGDEYMSMAVKLWAEGFRKFQPNVTFDIALQGTANGMPGLYLGTADIALLGREANVTDSDGFLHVLQYRPTGIELMSGSLDVPGKSYALVVYVHKDNPLARLTMAQLDAIFGCEKDRGVADIRSWGELGLTGSWAGHPINLYSFDAQSGTGVFFEHAALQDRRQMNWDRLREFKDIHHPDGSVTAAGQQIVDALKSDPYGIAISGLRFADPSVKPLAIAAKEGGPYVQPTRDTVVSREYPLARHTYAFLNRPPNQPIDPKIREFLRYALSQEGQEAVVREGQYLPLSDRTIAEGLKRLD